MKTKIGSLVVVFLGFLLTVFSACKENVTSESLGEIAIAEIPIPIMDSINKAFDEWKDPSKLGASAEIVAYSIENEHNCITTKIK